MKVTALVIPLLLATRAPLALASPGEALAPCTAITAPVPRLACFDRVAGTAAQIGRGKPARAPAKVAEIVGEVARHERTRPKGDFRFRLAQAQDSAAKGRRRVVISAPAQNRQGPRPLLVVSCIANITRLQFITYPAVARNQVLIGMSVDGRQIVSSGPWQVLENGSLVDAGRGLAGIEVVRQLRSGEWLQISSDLPLLHGLRFDARGLDELIKVQREACGW